LEDVVETRIYLTDITHWQAVGRAHGNAFARTRPATTMVQVGPLVASSLLVEISAVAVVSARSAQMHQDTVAP
jgi:enamine deaminase RidA (YjgF/YER057c/UK114 family)